MSVIHDRRLKKKIRKLQKRVRKNLDEDESMLKQNIRRFRRSKPAVISLILILFLVFIFIFATPFTLSVGYRDQSISYRWGGLITMNPYNNLILNVANPDDHSATRYNRPLPPGTYKGYEFSTEENITLSHLFGTNDNGQDIFSRIVVGTRAALIIAFGASIISLIIAMIIGLMAGFYGGKMDEILMRFTDVFLTLPFFLVILLAIRLVQANSDLINVLNNLHLSADVNFAGEMIGLGLFGWMGLARLIRSEVLRVRSLEYVEAAVAIGASPQRILTRHILPNILASTVIVVTLGFGVNIAAAAAIDFVLYTSSLGISSWGSDLSAGISSQYSFSSWWPILFPGAMITIAVLAFNILGDGLRDVLDPRLR